MSGVAELVSPTMARMIEMLTSGALPLLVFILLPAYSSWSSQPDSDDMRSGYRSVSIPHTSHLTNMFRRSRRDQSTNAPESRRDSLTSFGFD